MTASLLAEPQHKAGAQPVVLVCVFTFESSVVGEPEIDAHSLPRPDYNSATVRSRPARQASILRKDQFAIIPEFLVFTGIALPYGGEGDVRLHACIDWIEPKTKSRTAVSHIAHRSPSVREPDV